MSDDTILPPDDDGGNDERTADEIKDLILEQSIEYAKEEIEDLRHSRTLRARMFCLLIAWLILIAMAVAAQGFHKHTGFKLDPGPLSTVIGSGTIPVVAILVAILSYVFSRRWPRNLKDTLGKLDDRS